MIKLTEALFTAQPTYILTKAFVWYEIRVIWANITHALGFYLHESDLSNEVLYDLVGQEAAKISEVDFGGQKKSCRSARPQG